MFNERFESMLTRIIGLILYLVFGSAFFVIGYLGFSGMLSDDIEIATGKKSRHRWKTSKEPFFHKFLFLHFISDIPKWHYAAFILFIISCISTFLLLSIRSLVPFSLVLNDVLSTVAILCLISVGISAFSHWTLYRGNVIRRRPKK